jgi:hypothetical protein
MKYKGKTCCLIDFGLFVELAVVLAKEFDKVYYYNPSWRNAFPTLRDVTIARGLQNVEVITEFWYYKEKIDLFIFPDVYMGDYLEELKSQGKLCWGAGRMEWLELERWKFTDWLSKQNMPVPLTEESIGVDELEKDIKDGWFVKVEKYRGDTESFRGYGGKIEKEFFKTLRLQYGELANEISFMRQKGIDGVEVGYDGWVSNGTFYNVGMWGYEVKGCCYVGKMSTYSSMPLAIRYVNAKMEPFLKEGGMCGCISTEIRVPYDDAKKFYFIDPCLRMGNPPHQCQLTVIKNLPEMFMEGSKGKIVDPVYDVNEKFTAMAIMSSEFAAKNELMIKFPEKMTRFVKLKNLAILHKNYFVVPPRGNENETVGAVVGVGPTMKKAIEHCKENAGQIDAFRLEIDCDKLDKAQEVVNEGIKLGINF